MFKFLKVQTPIMVFVELVLFASIFCLVAPAYAADFPPLPACQWELANQRFELAPGLILRRMSRADMSTALDIITEPTVQKMASAAFDHTFTREQYETSWTTHSFEINTNGYLEIVYMIELNGVSVGHIGLRDTPPDLNVRETLQKMDPAQRWLEVGYVLLPEYWNRGIVTMATKRIVQIAFDIFHADGVVANSAIINLASLSVLTKAGFLYIGDSETAKHYYIPRAPPPAH